MEKTLNARGRRFFGPPGSLRRLVLYFILFLFAGFALFTVFRGIAYIGFSIMDDVEIQNLLNGSRGVSEGLCPYMSVFLGKLLAHLYRTAPFLNWYGVFLLAVLLVSCALAAAVLAHRLTGKAGFAAGFTVFPLIFAAALYHFTYTVIAYAALACAFACIAYAFYLQSVKTRPFLWICAGVLGVGAVMIREDAIASAAAMGIVYALFLFIRYKKAALKTVSVVAAVLLLSAGLTAAGSRAFASDPVWKEYARFNETRIDMTDRFYPAYGDYQAEFQKYGWTENDYDMFYSYNIPDDPDFSTDNLEKIDAFYKTLSRYNFNAGDIFASIWEYVSRSIPLVALLAAALALALLSSNARLLSVMVFLFPFLMQAGLAAIQRPLGRVVAPHYFMALLLLLCLIDTQALRKRLFANAGPKKRRALPLLALAAALAVSAWPLYNAFSYAAALEEQRRDPHVAHPYQNQQQVFAYFAQHKDRYFAYSMEKNFYFYTENRSIFETAPKDYYANSFALGGWAARTGEYEQFKKSAGVRSLPRDLIDNPGVCFVTSEKLGPYTQYFWETYGIPVKYALFADSPAGFKVLLVQTASSPGEMGTDSPVE